MIHLSVVQLNKLLNGELVCFKYEIHESESKPTREAIDIDHVITNGSRATGLWGLVLVASSTKFLLGKVVIRLGDVCVVL